MSPVLSFAIMTHNEKAEFGWLSEVLMPFVSDWAELVVLDDFSEPEMLQEIVLSKASYEQRPLNNDFSSQRNYLKGMCKGSYIFMIDADEIPPNTLLEKMPLIVNMMERNNIDACALPRFNMIIEGDNPIDARNLKINDSDLEISPRDDQVRIIKNISSLMYKGRVHEKLLGAKKIGLLPNSMEYALLHVKSRSRYSRQNSFYETIGPFSLKQLVSKIGIKKILVRFGVVYLIKRLMGEPAWIKLDPTIEDRHV